MEKKYYDIIVTLIKKNEKFIGCEPILDDIAQDVYEHSKVVLGSVSNEDVIAAYLNKVVATSLITVPKKLNYSTRNKHRVIKQVQAITGVEVQPIQNSIEEAAAFEETDSILEDISNDVVLEEQLDMDISTEDITTETENEDYQEENNLESELTIEEEFSIEPSLETEDISTNENTDAEQIMTLENDEEVDTENIIEEEDNDEHKSDVPVEEDSILQEDVIEEADVDISLVDNMINGVSTIDNNQDLDREDNILLETEGEDLVLELEEQEFLPNTIEDDIEELTLDIEEKTEAAPLAAAEAAEEEVDSIEQLHENNTKDDIIKETNLELPNYSCFNYEPEAPDFAEDEICSDLRNYNSKHPDRKILDICNLKYKEKMSVPDIADTLAISEEAVLETLNDIIELVKD